MSSSVQLPTYKESLAIAVAFVAIWHIHQILSRVFSSSSMACFIISLASPIRWYDVSVFISYTSLVMNRYSSRPYLCLDNTMRARLGQLTSDLDYSCSMGCRHRNPSSGIRFLPILPFSCLFIILTYFFLSCLFFFFFFCHSSVMFTAYSDRFLSASERMASPLFSSTGPPHIVGQWALLRRPWLWDELGHIWEYWAIEWRIFIDATASGVGKFSVTSRDLIRLTDRSCLLSRTKVGDASTRPQMSTPTTPHGGTQNVDRDGIVGVSGSYRDVPKSTSSRDTTRHTHNNASLSLHDRVTPHQWMDACLLRCFADSLDGAILIPAWEVEGR